MRPLVVDDNEVEEEGCAETPDATFRASVHVTCNPPGTFRLKLRNQDIKLLVTTEPYLIELSEAFDMKTILAYLAAACTVLASEKAFNIHDDLDAFPHVSIAVSHQMLT